jgi:hypothetical protein
MQSMRSMGIVLAAAMGMGICSSTAQAEHLTVWSTNAAACVPVSTFGLTVTDGAVTAGAGVTVTLYCGITRAALTGGFDSIEITYKGGAAIIVVGGAKSKPVIPEPGSVTSALIEMSKATGNENSEAKCAIQPNGSSVVTSESGLCNNSILDFNNNFYYVRIVLKSGLIAAAQTMTVFGVSLILTH